MKNALIFTICVMLSSLFLSGCAVFNDAKFLVEEALIPSAKETLKVKVKPKVNIDIRQNNLSDIAKNRTISFSGMKTGNAFWYYPKDNQKRQNKVYSGGTFFFLYPRDYSVVKVFYGYTQYAGRWHNLDPKYDYKWNESEKRFDRIEPEKKKG